MKEWIRKVRRRKLCDLPGVLRRKLLGYRNYHGVKGDSPRLPCYYYELIRLPYKWLNRRGQRRSMTRAQSNRRLPGWELPAAAVVEQPLQNRVAAGAQTGKLETKIKPTSVASDALPEESDAAIPHAGISEGAPGSRCTYLNRQEMKPLALLLALVFTLPLAGCRKGKTTNTVSSNFKTLAEKQEFLERYVTFRRSYDDLHFDLSYIDGGSGMVPGPTEWNVRVFAVVPAGEIDQWIDGLSVVAVPDLEWISGIPKAPPDVSRYKWYKGDRVNVGIDRESRTVLYWNHAP